MYKKGLSSTFIIGFGAGHRRGKVSKSMFSFVLLWEGVGV